MDFFYQKDIFPIINYYIENLTDKHKYGIFKSGDYFI